MKAYTHKVNPHYSATHADIFFEGWKYVTTASEQYPTELVYPLCFYKHQTLEAALDIEKQINSSNS